MTKNIDDLKTEFKYLLRSNKQNASILYSEIRSLMNELKSLPNFQTNIECKKLHYRLRIQLSFLKGCGATHAGE